MNEAGLLKKTSDFIKEGKADEYSPLNLAYIGDAVFELLVRSDLMSGGVRPVNELNKNASELVNARSQALMYHRVKDKLSEDELSALRRGRNAKSCAHAKNASVSDYRHATGLEALFGYLYLKGEIDRIVELFKICIDKE